MFNISVSCVFPMMSLDFFKYASLSKRMRGDRGGMSDHFLVEAGLKVLGGWMSSRRMEGARNVLKLSELNKSFFFPSSS